MRPRPEPPGLWSPSPGRSIGLPVGPSVPVSKPTQKPGDEDAVPATERERYIQCLKEVEVANSAGGTGYPASRRRLCELPPSEA